MSPELHDTPTEQDKQEDLERQYGNFLADPTTKIFCPWCFKANHPGTPSCCGFYTEGINNIGQRKLHSVIRQWREMRLGSLRAIHCPYCGKYVKKPKPDQHPSEWPRPMQSPFCCDMLSDAATAIVEREKLQQLVETKKRIEDQVTDVAKN